MSALPAVRLFEQRRITLKRLLLPAALVLLGCGCGARDRPATSASIVASGSKLDPDDHDENGEPRLHGGAR